MLSKQWQSLLLYCTMLLLLLHNTTATLLSTIAINFPVHCYFDAIAIRQPHFLHLLPLVNCLCQLSLSFVIVIVAVGICCIIWYQVSLLSLLFVRMNGQFVGVVLVLQKMCRVEAYWPPTVPPQNNMTLHPFFIFSLRLPTVTKVWLSCCIHALYVPGTWYSPLSISQMPY